MAIPSTLPIMMRNDSATAQSADDRPNKHYEDMEPSLPESLALTVLGVCSGASLSGVGCVLLRYRQSSCNDALHMEVLQYNEIAVPARSRIQILSLLRDHSKVPDAMTRVHELLGHMLSTAVTCFCSNNGISMDSIDLTTSQTEPIPSSLTRLPTPFRRGETPTSPDSWSGILAAETGLTTIVNPLTTRSLVNCRVPHTVASSDHRILQDATKFRVGLTINDFANISIIPPSSLNSKVPPSVNCGPGTMYINYAMRYATSNQVQHDRDGMYGLRGRVNEDIVDRFLKKYDYAFRTPPLDVTFEMFGQHEAQAVIDECLFHTMSDHDTVATISRITAQNIVRQYRRLMFTFFPGQQVDEIFLCGAGARNQNIVDFLESALPEDIITRPLEDIGIPGDAVDAVRSAHAGLCTVLRHISMTNGPIQAEQRRSPLENIVRGKKWGDLREKVIRFSGGEELLSSPRVVVKGR